MRYSYAKLSGEQVAELDELQYRFCKAGKPVVLLAVEQPYHIAALDGDAVNRITALEKELSGKQDIVLVAYAACAHCG